MRRLGLALTILGFAGLLAGSALPPIGDRAYVLPTGNRAAPVKIEKAGAQEKGSFLKDPIQPGSVIVPKASPPRPLAPAPKQVVRAGQLKFKAVLVNGHLIRPRVDFSRDVLLVERADEPVSQDFFDKIFEPAGRDDF